MRAPSTAELRDLVLRQVASLYPVSEREAARLEVAVPAALAACERSFSRIRNKYYAGADGAAVLDPLHGCQWAQFLYRLARALYLTGGGGRLARFATRFTRLARPSRQRICSTRWNYPRSSFSITLWGR